MGFSRIFTLFTASLLVSGISVSAQRSQGDPGRLGQPTRQQPGGSPGGKNFCENSPSNRQCWGLYDINTNFYTTTPDTGAIRTYNLELTQQTFAPDGTPRMMQLVNGQYPGPTLEANWGDTVVVHVTNHIPNNGTSIHFHGVRQLKTFQEDGAPGVTQCPVAPGQSITYTWRAHQYGSSWYHSHFSLQAWEGVLGGITIHGPASANYDEDLGNLFLTDFSYQTADELYSFAESVGPPQMDTGLINGTNVGNNGTTGKRFEKTFVKGKKYLLRIVNSAIDSLFKLSLDNHTLTVISTDFVPIQPYQTDVLSIGIAQRYDVIIEATDPIGVGNYWLRAVPQLACSDNANPDDIRGIIRYGFHQGDPTTTAYNVTDDCLNEPLSEQHPVVALNVGPPSVEIDEHLTLGKTGGVFKWFLNGTTFKVDWSEPTIRSIWENKPYTNQSDAIEISGKPTDWIYFIIETAIGVTHPIHLHGHDFYVLAAGTGAFDATVALNLNNPPRRDVNMLPASGHLVIAFQTDNPGAWLLHCHIGWHQSEGLALQFVENKSQIKAEINALDMENTCKNWENYFAKNPAQYDSGIRRKQKHGKLI
jgi:FtsP/CotA-like multicopper oxidase with cupredoxin domain